MRLSTDHRVRRQRRGFSLLEILLALAILGSSLAILSTIVSRGANAGLVARDLAIARILCQTKMAEVMLDATGGVSPTSSPAAPIQSFDSDSFTAFTQTVEVSPAPMDGLLMVKVTIEGLDSESGAVRARHALSRWMIDPLLGLEAAEVEEQLAREQASSAAEGEG